MRYNVRMRINKFVSQSSHLSRRAADIAIHNGRVHVDGRVANVGDIVSDNNVITLDGILLRATTAHTTIMLHKPVGYVCSRDGQGSKTIYDLLSSDLQQLNPVGRLDKDSSGLLLLTNDGDLANKLSHPRYEKEKVYIVTLDKPLDPLGKQAIEKGIPLGDGISKLQLTLIRRDGKVWQVNMHEGRNRQIRRTFAALNYEVTYLHRTQFGPYVLGALPLGDFQKIEPLIYHDPSLVVGPNGSLN